MILPHLQQENVYTIPAGEYFGKEAKACFLVYAPLHDLSFIASPEKVAELEALAAQHALPLQQTEASLKAAEHLRREPRPEEITSIFLIPNERCNFHCQYCYSAKGRCKDEISEADMKVMVDKVIQNAEHQPDKKISIAFLGGGEPLLSWDFVTKTVHYAQEQAAAHGIRSFFSLSTNGSLLTESIISFMLEHKMSVQISYEVLPDVQDAQRGQAAKVDANVRMLIDQGIVPVFRSTITALNVRRMEEMVEYCHQRYPEIKKLALEPVVDMDTFTTVEALQDFFLIYEQNFAQADTLAQQHGIELLNSSCGRLTHLKNRFCSPMYCLTPFGTLMDCPNVTTPHESGYFASVYGMIHEGEVVVDPEAFGRIMQDYTRSDATCAQCWAKWNCGGGCRSQRLVYPPEQFAIICQYRKKHLFRDLMASIARQYKEETGEDFVESIAAQL